MKALNKSRKRKKQGNKSLKLSPAKQSRSQTADELSDAAQIGRDYLESCQARAEHSLLLDSDGVAFVLSLSRKMMEANVPLESRRAWAEALKASALRMSTSVPGRPEQDLMTFEIVNRLLKRVDTATAKLGATTLSESVIGTVGKPGLSAFSSSFFRTTALIVVPINLMLFVHLL